MSRLHCSKIKRKVVFKRNAFLAKIIHSLASERIEDGLKQLDQRCVSIASSITSSETINRATYDSVQVLVREVNLRALSISALDADRSRLSLGRFRHA